MVIFYVKSLATGIPSVKKNHFWYFLNLYLLYLN
jgi:hypothetical protein